MASQFVLSGGYTTTPLDGIPSLAPNVDAPIDESMVVSVKAEGEYILGLDAPVAVAFGGITAANVVIIKAIGGKVRVRLTSADGSQQSIPVDSVLIITSISTPITAIDLTRVPATPCSARVYIAQMA